MSTHLKAYPSHLPYCRSCGYIYPASPVYPPRHPSSPSAYPFTAVIGVFKSCAILLMSVLFSFSPSIFSSALSFKRRRISSNDLQSSPISSLLSDSTEKSRLPSLIFCAAVCSFFDRIDHAGIHPDGQHRRSQHKDQQDRDQHINEKFLYLRNCLL